MNRSSPLRPPNRSLTAIRSYPYARRAEVPFPAGRGGPEVLLQSHGREEDHADE